MPIFVSRFSSGRVSGANLQQVRASQNQTVRQAQADGAGRQRIAQPNRQVNQTRREQVERLRESLLARTQQGERLAQQLREPGDAEQTTTRTETQSATDTAETTRQRQTEQRAERTTQRPSPGVGVERSQAERNVDRPGRLRRAPANPDREQALSRFSSLRAAAGRENRAEAVTSTTPAQTADGQTGRQNVSIRIQAQPERETRVQAQAQRLNSRIRFLAANNQGRAARALNRVADQLQDRLGRPGQDAEEPTPAVTQAPTAVEISRANTTPEIRDNLQADTRDVGQGLQRDGVRQTQLNTQRQTQSAERTASARQAQVQRESQSQVRALRTEQRQLERQLQGTQREIRSQENRGRRAQSSANRSTVATAAQIGANVNILAA